jgi:hypothetical protein
MKKILLIILLLATSLFAQKAQYGFTVSGGMSFPTDDFTNFYNASFGGFGGVFYNFSETGRVSATIGYNGWSVDLDALNENLANSGNTGKYNLEAPISAIPILIGVKFFFKTKMSFTPYVMAEGGIYKITREVYGQYINEDGSSIALTPQSEKSTDGALNIGFGIEYPINETMNFDINASYHYILNKDVYNLGDAGYASSYSTTNFISINAGLNIFFQ